MDAYEAKNQDLMAENADLKALLRSMQVTPIIVHTMIANLGERERGGRGKCDGCSW